MGRGFIGMRRMRPWLALQVSGTIATLSLGGCPPRGNPGDGTLAGTWAGGITYTVTFAMDGSEGSSYSFSHPFTVAFTADGLPDMLDLAVGNGEDVLLIPADGLLKVGDTGQATDDSTNPTTGAVTTTTADVTVTNISNSKASFKIGLNVNVSFSGDATGTMTGTYSVQAEVKPDGTVSWTGSSDWQLGDPSLKVGLAVTSSGTLARQ